MSIVFPDTQWLCEQQCSMRSSRGFPLWNVPPLVSPIRMSPPVATTLRSAERRPCVGHPWNRKSWLSQRVAERWQVSFVDILWFALSGEGNCLVDRAGVLAPAQTSRWLWEDKRHWLLGNSGYCCCYRPHYSCGLWAIWPFMKDCVFWI